MNATPHTLAGFTIIKTFEDNLAIGIPLAIVSHFVLDYINESGLSKKEQMYYDALPSVLIYTLALFSGNFWLFLLGSICGNLPDLIDKKLYLSIFLPDKFKMTQYLHWQKTLINPTANQTKLIGVVSFELLIILTLGL